MTDAELDAALERAAELARLDPEPDSPEGRELGRLVAMIEANERTRYPELFGV